MGGMGWMGTADGGCSVWGELWGLRIDRLLRVDDVVGFLPCDGRESRPRRYHPEAPLKIQGGEAGVSGILQSEVDLWFSGTGNA